MHLRKRYAINVVYNNVNIHIAALRMRRGVFTRSGSWRRQRICPVRPTLVTVHQSPCAIKVGAGAVRD